MRAAFFILSLGGLVMNLGILEEEQARRPLSTIRDVNGRVFTQLRVIDFIHSPYIAIPEGDTRGLWALSLACRINHPHSFFGLEYMIRNRNSSLSPFEMGVSFLEDILKFDKLSEITYKGITTAKATALHFDIDWKKKAFANPDKWVISSALFSICGSSDDRPRVANRHIFTRNHWVRALEEIPEESLFSL